MENEKMMAVLSELLEEQKEITSLQAEIMKTVQELTVKFEGIENVMKNQNPASTLVEIQPIQQTLERSIADIKFLIEILRQKSATSILRIFLESDAKKWAVYLIVAVIFLTYIYWFAVHK